MEVIIYLFSLLGFRVVSIFRQKYNCKRVLKVKSQVINFIDVLGTFGVGYASLQSSCYSSYQNSNIVANLLLTYCSSGALVLHIVVGLLLEWQRLLRNLILHFSRVLFHPYYPKPLYYTYTRLISKLDGLNIELTQEITTYK